MIKKTQNFRGFTLIELLVVISIIGIILSLAFVAFQETKKSARDTQRKADLEDIRSSLEVYKADCGDYHTANSDNKVPSPLTGDGSPSACSASNIYMFSVPNDPSSGRQYYYGPATNQSSYELCASLENIPGGNLPTCGGSCGETCNYKVTNP